MRRAGVVAAVIVVLAAIGLGVFQWLKSQDGPRVVEPGEPGTSTEARHEPDWCPSVEFVSIPGTWESSIDDDPFAPQSNPNSFMLSITKPLQERYPIDQVRVFTVPYTAQFRNIQTPQGRNEMSYDDSRAEGTARANGEIAFVAEQCSKTKFIVAGFSQGAVIAGDITSQIGAGTHALPPERLLGSLMIADGRRENGVGVNPGVELAGVGAEIALRPLQMVVSAATPGATMTGARPGGFGQVADRAYEICAPNDSICDAPQNIGNAVDRAGALLLANGNHAMYASNPDVIPGTTTPQWAVDWATSVIDSF